MSSISVYRPGYKTQDWTAWRVIAAMERLAALLLLTFLSPLLLILWIEIAMLSGRSPLIAHRRVGWRGSDLWLVKFRTMWDDHANGKGTSRIFGVERIEDEDGPGKKGPNDARVVSGFARFCRRHSLDELPQLLHVVLGQMSLVGPRPVTAKELDLIYGTEMIEILAVRPGLSGLWQVSGRNQLTIGQRCSLDLECIRRRSVKLYFSVLMRTIPEIVRGTGAW